MTDEIRAREHRAVDDLLPWYVNETLSAAEQARVRRHLDVCGECRDNVSLLARVNSVVGRLAATPILPARRPDRLLLRIDRLERRAWPERRRPMLALAASIAAAAIVLLLVWPDPDSGVRDAPVYETATSGSQRTSMGYVMNVEFEPDVGPDDRQRIFDELQASGARHDAAAGVWQVDITLSATSMEELTRFTGAVEARPEVRSAQIVAMRLPVESRSAQEGERQQR